MRRILFLSVCFAMFFGVCVSAQSLGGYNAAQWVDDASFHFSSRNFQQCLASASNAITLDDSLDYAYFLRGASYYHLGVYHQSVTELTTAIRLNPSNVLYYKWRGVALTKRYITDEALADFDKVLQLDPDDTFALSRRGQLYQSIAEHTRAIADFDRVIALTERNYFAYYCKADSCAEAGLNQQAVENYKIFIELADGKVKKSYITYAQDRISELSK